MPLGHSAAAGPVAGSEQVPREPCGPSAACYGVRRLRADDGIRTRDPHLGKVMLYQLSHVRVTAHRGRADAAGLDRRVPEL